MKHPILLSFVCLLGFSCHQNKVKINKIDSASLHISAKKIDTLFNDQKTLIIKSENYVDTLLKFASKINDSQYFTIPENITFTKKLDFSKYEYKKLYITATKVGVRENGVNFAGHFCFIYWGCGFPCQLSAVVDLKTGVVYNGLPAEMGYEFKKESRLIIVNPADSSGWYYKNTIWESPTEYIWTGKKFIRAKSSG